MDKAKLTFLGTGTSQGIPIRGCHCPVCHSADPRDKRLRASALVHWGGLTILIDCGPDFRTQMLRANVDHLDALLLTHNHKDHTGGVDDLRSFNLIQAKPVNIYCQEYVRHSLQQEYSYAFAEKKYPGSPEWNIHIIDSSNPFEVHSSAEDDDLHWVSGKGYFRTPAMPCDPFPPVKVIPVQGWHHKEKVLSVLGFRFGDIAYITDMNLIEDSELDKLRGLDAVTVNCVKRGQHFSHFSLSEALEFFEKVGAKESYITHISHLLPVHAELEKELPPHVHLAYDGLTIG